MTSEIETLTSTQALRGGQTVIETAAGVTEILLIRHGEAQPASREDDERADPPLTARGLLQAGRLAQHLQRHGGVARVYSSPLRRAQQTASEIAFEIDRPLVTVYDLREAEVRHRGAEPSASLRARVRRAMDNICAANPRRRVVVVCHGGVINAYLADLFGVAPDMLFLPRHAAINTLRLLSDAYFIVRLNDVDHLRAQAPQSSNVRSHADNTGCLH